MSITRLDPCITGSIQCCKVHEGCGGHPQRLFADKFLKLLQKGTDEFVGATELYVLYLNPDKLDIPHLASTVDNRLDSFRNENRVETIVATVQTPPKSYRAVRCDWLHI